MGVERMIPISYYLVVSAMLFVTGAMGVLIRRNALIMLMSLELMLNAVNLSFVAYARMLNDPGGHVFVFLSITVAAAEAAVGLAILLTIFRTRETVDVDNLHLMQH
jgi:NADH-quinone oxidoreductase subunit K